MVATIRESETYVQTMRRLGEAARNAGVMVFWDEVTHLPFATSRRDPSKLHQVTAISCTCQGFIKTGACGHIGLLLLELGYLDRDPDATPPAAIAPSPAPMVTCDLCGECMIHDGGVSFHCPCGHTWAAGWQEADMIDRRLCELSRTDFDRFAWAEQLLSRGQGSSEEADRDDVAYAIGLPAYSANEIAAVLCWQTDRADVADRMAA